MLALISVIVFLVVMVMPKMRKMQTLVDRLNLISRENLEGLLVIRAFNSQKFEEARFDDANRAHGKQSFCQSFTTIMMLTMMFIMNITTVLIVWIGRGKLPICRLISAK
ncbi:MAG: ABC transporter transmembrane domain-containing protein [Caldilineaceae bacterium]